MVKTEMYETGIYDDDFMCRREEEAGNGGLYVYKVKRIYRGAAGLYGQTCIRRSGMTVPACALVVA